MSAGQRIARRLGALDWEDVERELWELGRVQISRVLTVRECRSLVSLYPRDSCFRSTIRMERHRFGVGEYRYFSYPLPPLVESLRRQAYPPLASIANRWMAACGRKVVYPATLEEFLVECRTGGQLRPTPLLLRYEEGGYNCLHQDLYGDIFFPFQLVCLLSRPDKDFKGGEFLLVEQRPRSQSRGEAIAGNQGDVVIFPNSERPVRGARGWYRTQVRHGASRVSWGSRYSLGVIFHDAR